MPIYYEDEAPDAGAYRPAFGLAPSETAEAQEDAPTAGEVWGAAYLRENPLVSLIEGHRYTVARRDARALGKTTDFDPFEYAKAIGDTRLEDYVDVANAAEAAVIARRHKQEDDWRETIERGGFLGTVASISAGLTSPEVLIPWAGIAGRARAGAGVLRNTLATGAEAALATASTEALLQGSQETRTAEETLWNVGGSALFGGVLGGAFGLVTRRTGKPVEDLEQRYVGEFARAAGGGGSLSSAAVRTSTLHQEELANAFGLGKVESKNPVSDNPLLRTRTSPSLEVRRLSGELSETPYYLKGNDEGMASPVAVETVVKGWQAPLADTLSVMKGAFTEYRARTVGDAMSYGEFRLEVGRAMRRAEAHVLPEIGKAARFMRGRLFDRLKNEAIAVGLLPEDVTVQTAASYFTRLFDTDKINRNRNAFVTRLVDQFELDQLRSSEKLSRAELTEIANEVTNAIIGAGRGGRAADLVTANLRGPLRARTLNVPDEVIEEYLISDAEQVARYYARSMGAQVELVRRFGRVDMKDQLDAVNLDFDRLKAEAPDGPKQQKLEDQRRRHVRDLEAMRDRILGVYGVPDDPSGIVVRGARAVRNLNYVRLLGGAVVSATVDVGNIVVTHGFMRLFGKGLAPFATELGRVKLAKRELSRAAVALEMTLNTRAMQLGDTLDEFGRYSMPERVLQRTADGFSVFSGLSPWTDAMKRVSGLITQTRMLEAADALAAGRRVPAAEARRLAYLGIDAGMAHRIGEQFRRHGDADGAVWIPGTENWTDVDAVTAFRAAVLKETDVTIVTPGAEKPLWLSQEWGKTVGQFKSFAFSSLSRLTIRALQKRDADAVAGIFTCLALGLMVVWAKAKLSGQPLPKDPEEWAVQAVERSGLTGWLFDANDLVEKWGAPGIHTLTGSRASKYAQRDKWEAGLGPSAGAVGAAGQIGASATDGELSRSDLHKMRTLLPYQNHFALRWLFDLAEDGAGDAAGLPERQR